VDTQFKIATEGSLKLQLNII